MISPTSTAKAPVFAVVIHEKGGAERREVFEASEISVGRVQGNDLMLAKGNVSKRHARVLHRAGLLDDSGRFVTDEKAREIAPYAADRLTAIGQERVFVLHRPHPDAPPEESVYLSQRDVRELRFALA